MSVSAPVPQLLLTLGKLRKKQNKTKENKAKTKQNKCYENLFSAFCLFDLAVAFRKLGSDSVHIDFNGKLPVKFSG